MSACVAEREGFSMENEVLMDKCAGLYNAFYSLGAIIAPILGGMLNDSYGYRTTNDIMAFISLSFCLFYFITNTKIDDFRCKK